MSPFFWLLYVFNTYHITITYSQNYLCNNNYKLSHSNWEATCLFYYDTHLASIHNESQFIEAQTTIDDTVTYTDTLVWIGLSDTAEEGTWQWTDGTVFDYGSNYAQHPWLWNNPSGGSEDCVEINIPNDHLWNDRTCIHLFYGLCAYPKPTPVINDKSSDVRIRQQPGYIGMIDILDEIYIEFYITFTSWPAGWGNILQFGDSDTQKYPGIYINGVTHNVMSSFATVTTSNPEQSTTTSGYSLNTEYHYTLYQTQRRLTVTFGDDYVYDDIYDYTAEVSGIAASHPIVMNQAINLGSNWNDDFGATIRNLVVTTANSPETTFWNYLCDWDDRWTTRGGGSWSWELGTDAIAGDCSVRQNSSASDGRVAWMGEKDPASLIWTDYKLEMLINLSSGIAVGPLFRATNHNCDVNDCGNSYHLTMRNDGYEFVKFDGSLIVLYNHSMDTDAHSLDTPYLVRVECVGNTFKIYEENEYLFSYSDGSYAAGSVGFRTYGSDARISKVRITFPLNQQLYITDNPSAAPTLQPTKSPTLPTYVPSKSPTTLEPTTLPTTLPTKNPTSNPSEIPSTLAPTLPTKSPSNSPTNFPTNDSNIHGNQKSSNCNHVLYGYSNCNHINIAVITIAVCFICGVAALCFYKFCKKKQANNPGENRDNLGDVINKTDMNVSVKTNDDKIDKNVIKINDETLNKNYKTENYGINEEGAKAVNVWLDSIGLLRYYDMFIQHGFDSLEMIQEISDESDLRDIGITLKAHRLKILNHIKTITYVH